MVRQADVVIVGAGPAGSTAACVLARRGVDVLVLDKATFPRDKLCGGLLTWKALALLERLHGLVAREVFSPEVLAARTDRFAVLYRSRPLIRGRVCYPFSLVRRAAFDQLLLDQALAAGARFVDGCAVQGGDARGRLRTNLGAVHGHFVIGADGVNSALRRICGLSGRSWRHNLAGAVECAVPMDVAPRVVDHPELYAGILPAGYGWVFPNATHMLVGLCGLSRRTTNFRNVFREFLRLLGERRPEAFLRAHGLRGHPLPYGNALRSPGIARTLLAGDAAGFADPLLGEGIFYAMLSGWYAGEAVADAFARDVAPGLAYRERLAAFVFPEMRGANRLRWLLHGLEHGPGVAGMGLAVGSARTVLAEIVHGLRSYAWGRKKQWDFLIPE